MYKIFTVFASILLLVGCNSPKLNPKDLTNVSVVRNTEGQNASTSKSNTSEENTQTTRDLPKENYRPSSHKSQYYIIVASYPSSDRQKAEKLKNGLKDKGYPAEIIDAKGRLRVSIESFSVEEEAYRQRDKYREITDRQDIWILKD